MCINPLIATLKPQSNGPIQRLVQLAVDGWAVSNSDEGTKQGRSPPRSLHAVPNVTVHPSTASVPTMYYSM